MQFTVTIMCVDIIDETKEKGTTFYGKTNLQDVMNSQLSVVARLVESLKGNRGGALSKMQMTLVGEPTAEMMYQEFENKLAGWGLEVNIAVMADVSNC